MFDDQEAIRNALRRGLYADNLVEIAALAKRLGTKSEYNVATWALIHLGFAALATHWDEPVDADTASAVERRLLPACEAAVVDPTPYATENLARALMDALTRF